MGDTVVSGDSGSNRTGLWAGILSDVQRKSAANLAAANVVLLGAKSAGKTSIVSKLTSVEAGKVVDGMGVLEYTYANVTDEDAEETMTRIGVWTLDGDVQHKDLLRHALNAKTLAHSIVVIAVDLSQPWTMLDDLQLWLRIVEEHVESIRKTEKAEDLLMELRDSNVQFWQNYGESGTVRLEESTSETGESKIQTPLDPQILSTNLGVPIVIVGCKSDLLASLEKDNNYKEEHFDFMQQNLRTIALSYGAALIYISCSASINCDLLKRYLLHRLYNFKLNRSYDIVNRDAVFIPAGWDRPGKIAVLREHMETINIHAAFEDVIRKPAVRKTVTSSDHVIVQDEQEFLESLQNSANSAPAPVDVDKVASVRSAVAAPVKPASKSATSSRPATAESSTASSPTPPGTATPASATGAVGATPAAGSEVLHNFFNSLLTKKPGVPATGAATRKDAAAELDRIRNGAPGAPPKR